MFLWMMLERSRMWSSISMFLSRMSKFCTILCFTRHERVYFVSSSQTSSSKGFWWWGVQQQTILFSFVFSFVMFCRIKFGMKLGSKIDIQASCQTCNVFVYKGWNCLCTRPYIHTKLRRLSTSLLLGNHSYPVPARNCPEHLKLV